MSNETSPFGNPDYAITRHLPGASYEATIEAVRAALATQGFGVLTEIDVKATLKKKLDADVAPYIILGACNPKLAHRALTAEPGIGVLLPCNVVVAQADDGVIVSAIDPRRMFEVVGRPDVAPLAEEVRSLLEAALAAVG